jgi:hypothetical protein
VSAVKLDEYGFEVTEPSVLRKPLGKKSNGSKFLIPEFNAWRPYNVTYYFSTSLPIPEAWKPLVNRGFQIWSQVGNLSFFQVARPDYFASRQGSVTIRTLPPDYGDALAAVEYANFADTRADPDRFNFVFNESYRTQMQIAKQFRPVDKKKFVLQSVILHEVGHAALLGDIERWKGKNCDENPDASTPTMCGVLPPGTTWHTSLAPYDKNDIKTNYP